MNCLRSHRGQMFWILLQFTLDMLLIHCVDEQLQEHQIQKCADPPRDGKAVDVELEGDDKSIVRSACMLDLSGSNGHPQISTVQRTGFIGCRISFRLVEFFFGASALFETLPSPVAKNLN